MESYRTKNANFLRFFKDAYLTINVNFKEIFYLTPTGLKRGYIKECLRDSNRTIKLDF